MARIVFHGDSNSSPAYVAGASNWTAVVAAGLGVTDVVNLAQPGYYTQGVRDQVPLIIGHAPDLALIMVGTNDMANALETGIRHHERMVDYLSQIEEIIDRLRAANVPVAILSPIFSLKAREAVRFAEWVSCLRTICLVRSVPFVDVWTHMVNLSATQTEAQFTALYNGDAYHLSPAGHAMLAQFVLTQVQVSASPQTTASLIQFESTASSPEDVSTYTFPARPIGLPSADRSIIVAVGSRANAARSVTSVTVNGVSAHPIIARQAGFTEHVGLYRAPVPDGSSATIVVSFSGPMLRCSIAVFSVRGGMMAHAHSNAAPAGSPSVTLALDVFGGAIAAGWYNSPGGAAILSGVTKTAEQNPEAPVSVANTFVAGHVWLGSNQAARPISMASSSGFNGDAVLVAASWD